MQKAYIFPTSLSGVFGIREIRPLISGEQPWNKSLKLKGTWEQRQFGGTGNIENRDFDFGEQGKMSIFSRERVPPPLPTTHTHTHTPPPREVLKRYRMDSNNYGTT